MSILRKQDSFAIENEFVQSQRQTMFGCVAPNTRRKDKSEFIDASEINEFFPSTPRVSFLG
jgi:hypothetical protein